MNETNNELGLALRAWRQTAGLSIERAAARLGVTASTLSRWERGLCRPHPLQRAAVERELATTKGAL